MAMNPLEDPQFRAMFALDDAIAIWQELDVYKRGVVPADQVARLIEGVGHYTIPPAEAQYIGLIFNSFSGKIEEDNFLRMLSGTVPYREEPNQEGSSLAEGQQQSPDKSKPTAPKQSTAKTAASTQQRTGKKTVGF